MGNESNQHRHNGHPAVEGECKLFYCVLFSIIYSSYLNYSQFKCCGLSGPDDYIESHKPIPESCYAVDQHHTLYKYGCLAKLIHAVETFLKGLSIFSYTLLGVEVSAKDLFLTLLTKLSQLSIFFSCSRVCAWCAPASWLFPFPATNVNIFIFNTIIQQQR